MKIFKTFLTSYVSFPFPKSSSKAATPGRDPLFTYPAAVWPGGSPSGEAQVQKDSFRLVFIMLDFFI